MKKFISIIAMIGGLYSAGIAMEASLGSSELGASLSGQRIEIKNNTNWELVVEYSQAIYGTMKPFQIRLHPGEVKEIAADVNTFDNLTVALYGEQWKRFQLGQPTNLMGDIKTFMRQHPNTKTLVVINPAQGVTGWVAERLGEAISSIVRPIESFTRPFEFNYQAIPQAIPTEPTGPIPTELAGQVQKKKFLIIGAFPGVSAALGAGRPIIARYYLDVPADANLDSINKAYSDLKSKWTAERASGEIDDVKATIVLRILELAHTVLVAEAELKVATDQMLAEKK